MQNTLKVLKARYRQKLGIPQVVSYACFKISTLLKEVLRRENQGLKVYPVDGSPVFSMTGNYF
jgi:hypothetical protein